MLQEALGQGIHIPAAAAEYLRRALVRGVQNFSDLFIHLTLRIAADGFGPHGRLEISAQEKRPRLRTERTRAETICHAVLGHHRGGDICGPLQIVLCACGYLFEYQDLSSSSSKKYRDTVLKFGFRE